MKYPFSKKFDLVVLPRHRDFFFVLISNVCSNVLVYFCTSSFLIKSVSMFWCSLNKNVLCIDQRHGVMVYSAIHRKIPDRLLLTWNSLLHEPTKSRLIWVPGTSSSALVPVNFWSDSTVFGSEHLRNHGFSAFILERYKPLHRAEVCSQFDMKLK